MCTRRIENVSPVGNGTILDGHRWHSFVGVVLLGLYSMPFMKNYLYRRNDGVRFVLFLAIHLVYSAQDGTLCVDGILICVEG